MYLKFFLFHMSCYNNLHQACEYELRDFSMPGPQYSKIPFPDTETLKSFIEFTWDLFITSTFTQLSSETSIFPRMI